ncbi:MAG TPA: CHRD domain-containing protein [Acidobacteriota bacterium]|nr:CHRD domain-containing protein [Acidobacteriota bacterium]
MNGLSRITVVATTLVLALAGPNSAVAKENFNTHLNGASVVPARSTQATGQATFLLAAGGMSLDFRVNVANIANVTAARIHIGAPGENGLAVATLYGPEAPGGGKKTGVLTKGTITAATLEGSLAGRPLSDLIAEMQQGRAYVVITTDDGVGAPDEKPGDFSSGEIRGQIR